MPDDDAINYDTTGTPRTPPALAAAAMLPRLALAAVFIFAAATKLSSPRSLALAIEKFKWTTEGDHDHLVKLAAFVIPWTELLCAACLILGLWTRTAAFLLTASLGAFTWAIVAVLQRGETFECSCFGRFSFFCPKQLTWCNVYQNSVLIAIGLAALAIGGGRFSLDRLLRRGGPPKVEA
ncbi:MAG: DoxX family protein [Phycisphaerales bacterium]